MDADIASRVGRSRKAPTAFSTTTSGSDTAKRGRYIMSSSSDTDTEEEQVGDGSRSDNTAAE